jgi:hypothetical protein
MLKEMAYETVSHYQASLTPLAHEAEYLWPIHRGGSLQKGNEG